VSGLIQDKRGARLKPRDTRRSRRRTHPTMGEVIEAGIDDGKVFIAFQPVIDLRTKRVFGYEALVRSQLEGLTSPLDLIGAACGDGSMGKVGRGLRRLAVEGCPRFPLFLNLHPAEFAQPWLVRPDDAISDHERDVYLEITESVPLSHYEHCHSVLKEIRNRGAKIAIDDLGAGYSNLKYIADLVPEIVKIDRELVKDIRRDTRLHSLVTSIVTMCTHLGALVVAEGIETRTELQAVIDTGAHYGQGYYLGRPSPELGKFDWDACLAREAAD
jgi:EAL domain-containing protein (putative c-di-GMP-specific phosphodiesterase class I)